LFKTRAIQYELFRLCSQREHENKNGQQLFASYGDLVKTLQLMLHKINPFIKDLKTDIDKVPATTTDYKMIIHADRTPTGTGSSLL